MTSLINAVFILKFERGFMVQVRTVKIIKIRTPKINCCNYPKIGTVSFYYRVMGPKDADRMANSVEPDQTAPRGLIRVYSVYHSILSVHSDLSVRKLRNITVSINCTTEWQTVKTLRGAV